MFVGKKKWKSEQIMYVIMCYNFSAESNVILKTVLSYASVERQSTGSGSGSGVCIDWGHRHLVLPLLRQKNKIFKRRVWT